MKIQKYLELYGTEVVTYCSRDDPLPRARDALKTRLDQKELEVNVLKDTVIAARGG